MPAQAYTFADLTFCEPCALLNTGVGMILAGLGAPKNMDDAIAAIVLTQALNGLDIDAPVSVANDAAGVCDNCGKTYEPRTEGSDAA